MKRANVTYFLDGAHNIDSMEVQGWGGGGQGWSRAGWGGVGVGRVEQDGAGVGRGETGECECVFVPWSDSVSNLSGLLPVV